MKEYTISCPTCKRTRKFLPRTNKKDSWSTECFFCGKKFKVCPKRKMSRIV